MGGPSTPSPAIRPAVPHHRAPPLRPPLRARLFRARAALRLAPPSPPPALRVCARRCGFFSGLRGAPLLAPALAGTRLLSISLARVELWPAAETPQAAPPVSNPSRRGSCPGNPCPVAVPEPPLRPSCRPTPEPGGGRGDVSITGIRSLSSGVRAFFPPASSGAGKIPEVPVSSPLLRSGVLETLACLFLPLTALREPKASSRSGY